MNSIQWNTTNANILARQLHELVRVVSKLFATIDSRPTYIERDSARIGPREYMEAMRGDGQTVVLRAPRVEDLWSSAVIRKTFTGDLELSPTGCTLNGSSAPVVVSGGPQVITAIVAPSIGGGNPEWVL